MGVVAFSISEVVYCENGNTFDVVTQNLMIFCTSLVETLSFLAVAGHFALLLVLGWMLYNTLSRCTVVSHVSRRLSRGDVFFFF
jgi:hypothetical protein